MEGRREGAESPVHRIIDEARRMLEGRRQALAAASDEEACTDLDQVLAALRRIEDGSYGRCTDCGRSIGRLRLRALPEAAFCLVCEPGEP
jgi:DnaK suppressor protein